MDLPKLRRSIWQNQVRTFNWSIANDLSLEDEVELIALLTKFRLLFLEIYRPKRSSPLRQCNILSCWQKELNQLGNSYMIWIQNMQNQEEIQKLLNIGFIYPIEHTNQASPIMVAKKKNGKFRVCVDLKKVNAVTGCNCFPLPFTEHVLKQVVDKETYNLMDFSDINRSLLIPKINTKQHFQPFEEFMLPRRCSLALLMPVPHGNYS